MVAQGMSAFLIILVGSLLNLLPGVAQTTGTATVLGTVRDPTEAVIPGATVELTDLATNQTRSQTTNMNGQYIFVNVLPGVYKITASASGFRQAVIPSLKIEVAKAYTVDFTLEVGTVAEMVEVTPGAGVELQTVNATIGNVIRSDYLLRLPLIDRQANSLFQLQPMVSPLGYGFNASGAVAGARGDQATWMVDGIDVTQGKFPDTGDATSFPLPAESIEEFRAGVTNVDAFFGRSAGGQFVAVRKRGGNTVHGSVYWYHQNDNLNANTWTRNRLGQPDPELKDHRFGFTIGGPIRRDKTFFFFHYEGRRFPSQRDILRIVPTETMRRGVLRFRDGTGQIVEYPLATSTLCGPNNNSPCDPRGLGLNPVIRALFAFYPQGNDPSSGDGLNTIGFRAPASAAERTEYAWLRLDHHFTENWRFEGSFGWHRNLADSPLQVDIGGLLRGNILGRAKSVRSNRQFPRNIVAALTGSIRPNVTNDLRFGFTRFYFWRQAVPPFPQVPGTNVALDLAATLLDEPVDVFVQRSRSQGDNQQLYQFSDNMTWIKGSHTMQFGATARIINHYHMREDKVVGGMSALIGLLDAGAFFTVPAEWRPPTCGGTLQQSCLRSVDISRWNRFYAALLGIIDNVSIMMTRNADFTPLPFGTPLMNKFRYQAWDIYASDVWRVRPSLTFSYGVNYQIQVPTKTLDGRLALAVDAAAGRIITPKAYLEAKRQAALQGTIFNPTIGYMPIRMLGREKTVDTDWNNIGPRVALAWHPRFEGGLLGRVLGARKTVFRGGYSLTFDRLNLVQLTSIPMLAAGFGQTISIQGPKNARGEPFRIGVDGPAPLPVAERVTPPLIPSVPFGELLSFQADPMLRPGMMHSINFTIQRELPGDMLLELGYVGRLGRNLPQSVNLNSIPFFMKDPVSGQTFAEAYDALAAELRAGVAAGAVTPQPWFENQMPSMAMLRQLGLCPAASSTATSCLASRFTSEIVTGLLSNFWLNGIDRFRRLAGLSPFMNTQVQELFFRTDGGISNYHAFMLIFRKRPSHGLQFDFNYTLSKSLDQVGSVQNSAGMFPSSFFPDLDYGPSFFDHTHIANLTWYCELPFGPGRRFSAGNWVDKLIGGWFTGGILTAFSGAPLTVVQSTQVFGGGTTFSFGTGAIPIKKPKFGNEVHRGVTGSGNVGTAGDPARGGTGLNLFADPEAVFKTFRPVLLSRDRRSGRGVLRGLPHWNIDFSVGKAIAVREMVKVRFSFDFFNILNRVEFADPTLDLRNPAEFGVLSSQFNQPRRIQFGLRVEF